MKKRWAFPLRFPAALLIGAGCALYEPFAGSASAWAPAVRFFLWGGLGLLSAYGLNGKLHKRLLRYTAIPAFFLALSFVLGARLQLDGALSFALSDAITMLGVWALSFLLLCQLFVNVPVWLKAKRPQQPIPNARLLWAVSLGFFVLACGWLLAYFPIMTNYDIDAHLLQIAAHQYETHHSLLYTLLLEGLLRTSAALGLGNTWAFFALGLLQTAVMGLTIAYGLVTINTARADRRAVIAAAIYFCVFPLFGYFAFSTTKDTLFACALALTAVELYRLSRGFSGVWGAVRTLVFAMLSCLLRYNGILTLILFGASIAMYAAFRLLRHRPVTAMLKRTLALLPVAVLLGTGAGALLNLAAGAVTPETVQRDMMGLPLEQMARVLQTATDEADIARIEGLFGVDDIRERYRPDISDPVKAAFLFPNENTVSALRAWLKLSVKYPKAYLEAFLEITRGAWFVDDLSHTKIDYWLDYTGYLETVQKYDKAAFPIAYQTPLPKLRAFIDQTFMENRYLEVPLVRYLFALAVQSWIAVLGFLYAAYHRRRYAMQIFAFAVCALLPVLLLPCMISRYFLPLFLLNPLCLLALTTRKENAA